MTTKHPVDPATLGADEAAARRAPRRSGDKDPRAPAADVFVSGVGVPRGTSCRIDVPIARLPTQSGVTLPLMVIHGRRPGPKVWLSAAVHGDELNGVEIVRRVLDALSPATLRGVVFAIPIVNVFGFLGGSRYLPDRRDLNRSFPGSRRGSMAARLAHVFMTEIVAQCQYGMDFHTAGMGNVNAPQIRADLSDDATLQAALAFGAPLILDAHIRDGSLRQAAAQSGARALLFEGGEPLKFDAVTIDAGVHGALAVMRHWGMLDDKDGGHAPRVYPRVIRRSRWVRARASGIFRARVKLMDEVARGDVLGVIADAFGADPVRVRAPIDGVVVGMTTNPAVNEGDALVHLGDVAATAVAVGKARR